MSGTRLGTRLRHHKLAVGLAAAAIVASVSAVLASQPSTASVRADAPVPASALKPLTATALRMAGLERGRSLTSVQAVTATRAQALQVATPGDRVPGAADSVYLVVMKGTFRPDVPAPPHARLSGLHWRYLSIVVDPATMRVTDIGIGASAPRTAIRSLGPVANLLK